MDCKRSISSDLALFSLFNTFILLSESIEIHVHMGLFRMGICTYGIIQNGYMYIWDYSEWVHVHMGFFSMDTYGIIQHGYMYIWDYSEWVHAHMGLFGMGGYM